MICAIILAAGNASRFNSPIYKQFHQLNGRILLDYPIQTFSQCDEVDQLIIVVPAGKVNTIQDLYPHHHVISGGKSRRESSFNGLTSCPPETDKVLIHDAARALIDQATILRCIDGLEKADAISTVVPVKDTVVETNGNNIVQVPNRNLMFLEQTPQGFSYHILFNAHKNIKIDVTDDIRLVKESGIECKVVEGSEQNFKITTQQDFQLAEILLKGINDSTNTTSGHQVKIGKI